MKSTRPPCDFGRHRRRGHRCFVMISAPGGAAAGAHLLRPGGSSGRGGASAALPAPGGRPRPAVNPSRPTTGPGVNNAVNSCFQGGRRESAQRLARPPPGLPALQAATGTMGKMAAVRFSADGARCEQRREQLLPGGAARICPAPRQAAPGASGVAGGHRDHGKNSGGPVRARAGMRYKPSLRC